MNVVKKRRIASIQFPGHWISPGLSKVAQSVFLEFSPVHLFISLFWI